MTDLHSGGFCAGIGLCTWRPDEKSVILFFFMIERLCYFYCINSQKS